MTGPNLHVLKPKNPDDIVTIVALTLRKPVTRVLESGVATIFDDPAYGSKLLTKEIMDNDWSNGEYTIDLGEDKNLTGIRIYESDRAISISTSSDNKSWQDAGEAVGESADIPVTTFLTGAYVPGKPGRYLRLKTNNPSSLKLDVYTK